MIAFEEALKYVLEHTQDYGTEIIPFSQADNRVLAEPVLADRDFPPFNRSTRDGIAINSKALEEGLKQFQIKGVTPAGSPQLNLENHRDCIEIMTGAILPNNTDTIIMYEHLERVGDAFILKEDVSLGQNIHFQASDFEKGATLLEPGIRLSAAEIGVLASVGKHEVLVKTNPKVAIVSTGDELVDVDQIPLPYQIRKSNSYSLQSLLKNEGILSKNFHLVDDKEILAKKLKEQIQQQDVLILSGGVSKGKYDFLPEVFNELGVEKVFHRVLQRPGKPFWFGKAPNGTLVFALPGNPVSSFLCTQRYFVTWLNASLGLSSAIFPHGILTRATTFKPDLTYFLQVKVSYNENGQILATPVDGNGSGDLANLVDADAFLQLPRGKDLFEKGTIYPLLFYR